MWWAQKEKDSQTIFDKKATKSFFSQVPLFADNNIANVIPNDCRLKKQKPVKTYTYIPELP